MANNHVMYKGLGSTVSNTKKIVNGIATNQTTIIESFKKENKPTILVPAIESYLKTQKMEVNAKNALLIYNRLNSQRILNLILPTIKERNPQNEKDIKLLQSLFREEGYDDLDIKIAISHYFFSASEPGSTNWKTKLDHLKNQSKNKPENIIAIEKLVQELESSYTKLIELDTAFIEKVVEKRPIVSLTMLTKSNLRNLLLQKYREQLLSYSQNEEVYKQLLPFIQIMNGKTHGQWRHLADPAKTCIVLYAKNCKLASSKNTQKSYSNKEIDGQFLVLEGLSLMADSDDAEVHYVEV